MSDADMRDGSGFDAEVRHLLAPLHRGVFGALFGQSALLVELLVVSCFLSARVLQPLSSSNLNQDVSVVVNKNQAFVSEEKEKHFSLCSLCHHLT